MIYILHFEYPHHHARHYVGYTADGRLDDRIAEHLTGDTPLLRAMLANGNRFCVARTLDGDRTRERQIKNTRSANHYCPICCGRALAPADDSPEWYGADTGRLAQMARSTWRAARALVQNLRDRLAAEPGDDKLLGKLNRAIARRRQWARTCAETE